MPAVRPETVVWSLPPVHAVPLDMTAIGISAMGGPDMLQPIVVPVPLPGPDEVLIEVTAAGVNRPDVLQRRGFYPPPPGASPLPGLEIAGRIVAVGSGVLGELVGQRVCALVAGGGYAEYAVADARLCLPLPETLSDIDGAAMPETLFTVWHNLFERGWAVEGETILVHGGTSGIGTMAIKLGGLFGIAVIVTCGSDGKCAAAIRLGARAAINYNTADFVQEVMNATANRGVGLVLDMVGGDYLSRNLACLAEDGRHVSIAVQHGVKAEIDIATVMRRRLILTGSTLRPRAPAFKALLADEIAHHVWPFVESGRLRPEIDSIFPLTEAAEAHRRMESGAHIGKIVLQVTR